MTGDTPAATTVLLSGIVGSRAYGLARENSDIDRLGVYAMPTRQLHGLRRPSESYVTKDPDVTVHEAAKWCRLALSGNPTVMELVWLPDDLYEVRTALGDDLISIRSSFLSAKRVRDAYFGYAVQQFRRLESRSEKPPTDGVRKRTAKHARHLHRLLVQGFQLWATGTVEIRLESPELVVAFGERVARGDVEAARELLTKYEYAFDEAATVLPDVPDEAVVEKWLHHVRAIFYKPVEDHA